MPQEDFDKTAPHSVIAAFPPSSDLLLATAASLVTDDMLEEISRADYEQSANEHLAELRTIRDKLRLPAEYGYTPWEVLELIRWSQPDDPTWAPGSTGERGHIMRAFCCAALLRGALEPDDNQTLIQLIESSLFLGRGLPEAAARFLTWRIPLINPRELDRPAYVFGWIAVALLAARGSFSPSDVGEMIEFIRKTEAECWDAWNVSPVQRTDRSFLNDIHSMREAAWRALATRLRVRFPDDTALAELALRIEYT